MLSINNLSKKFGNTKAIDNLSFNVNSGIIFGILGPNGAGKSTLLRTVLNILTPDHGTILINGIKNTDYPLDKIGYLPEDRGLYQQSKVSEVLKYFGRLKSLSSNQLNSKIEYWTDKFDLSQLLNKKIYELSKGNQQKVQFLVSIIHDPEILILDEPFTGFDPINQNLILEIISDFKIDGKIILLSTHLLELAEKFCSEIILINKGRQIISGNLNKIKSNYSVNQYAAEINGDYKLINKSDLINEIVLTDGKIFISVDRECSSRQLLYYLNLYVEVLQFYKIEPSLTDIFLSSINNLEQFDK